ncbi:hypothetical protein DBR43_31100 [Pedobacter sp. KBW06]|uniref:hypothetical protein n=1 Tax=Pedobacter sp. KBW06 TaxID=2153359 RepID=UPI000F59A8B8|nr:hypothetical protein [Pedobacter sp. KBW06]RQO65294.1 hypothetical protein DBR43_31100 [Pedobacter sp. KBW06]
MKTIYIMALATLFCLESSAQIKNYDNSGSIKIVGEKTILRLTEKEIYLEKGQQAAGLLTAVGTIAPALIGLGVKTVQEKLKNEALKYTGTYKAANSAQGFYSSSGYVKPPIIEVERKVFIAGGQPVTAAKITFIPELSKDQTAFRYKLDTGAFLCRYSIAKIRSGYNLLDLTVEIKVKNLSVAAGEYKLNELRSVLVTIPMVRVNATTKFGEDIYSGWIPFPPRSTVDSVVTKVDKVSQLVKSENLLTNKLSTHAMESKASSTYGVKVLRPKKESSELYEVEVIVTETNPFKIRAEQRKAFVDSTAESGTALLKAIVEAAVPKPKE